MALQTFDNIIQDIKNRNFSPIYILMGEEPYYSDIILEKLIETVLTPQEKEFNQTIMYGADTNAAEVVQLCRRFPMFSEKQLIVIKEAQAMGKTEAFEFYFDQPSPETILVLAFNGKNMDKRSRAYTKAKDKACIFESNLIKEWETDKWIIKHIKSKGFEINTDAAILMAEFTGNSLRKIALECNKLITGLSEGNKTISIKDIEKNIGISKEFSAFELCNSITRRDYSKSFDIAYHLGSNSKKYPLTLTLGAMFYYFSRLLKCHSYYYRDKGMPERAAEKAGVYRNQVKDYVLAMRNFPLKKNIQIISLIREYDYKSKSNSGGNASEGELLIELVTKIMK